MFGVLPDWASLQDQANLTLAIRINNIQHSSRFLSVLSCYCRFHFDSFISLNIYMYFRLLLFFTMYNILLELQSQAVEVYLTADIFLLKMIPTVISFAFKTKNCKIFLHSNMLSFWNVVTCILSKCRCW